MTAWLHSLYDVDRLRALKTVPVSETSAVTVQAYLTSGSDLRRYVVSGVDPGIPLNNLAASLEYSTHKVEEACYMGPGRTCFVTLQDPLPAPTRITHFGGILQHRLYKPGVVHCYQCFRLEHMRVSCPYPADASIEFSDTPKHRCGLIAQTIMTCPKTVW